MSNTIVITPKDLDNKTIKVVDKKLVAVQPSIDVGIVNARLANNTIELLGSDNNVITSLPLPADAKGVVSARVHENTIQLLGENGTVITTLDLPNGSRYGSRLDLSGNDLFLQNDTGSQISGVSFTDMLSDIPTYVTNGELDGSDLLLKNKDNTTLSTIDLSSIPHVIKEYPLTFTGIGQPNSSSQASHVYRRVLRVMNGFGLIHLDFKVSGTASSGRIAYLGSDAPRPVGLIEMQTADGGIIYMNDGSTTLESSGLTAGKRYIINLVGFFKPKS